MRSSRKTICMNGDDQKAMNLLYTLITEHGENEVPPARAAAVNCESTGRQAAGARFNWEKIFLKIPLKSCQQVITKHSEVSTCLLFKLGFHEYFQEDFFPIESGPRQVHSRAREFHYHPSKESESVDGAPPIAKHGDIRGGDGRQCMRQFYSTPLRKSRNFALITRRVCTRDSSYS